MAKIENLPLLKEIHLDVITTYPTPEGHRRVSDDDFERYIHDVQIRFRPQSGISPIPGNSETSQDENHQS